MITVFTLCSANYLAHAKTLGDSLQEHNPDYQFVIGLVDELPRNLAPCFWHPHELIPVEDIGIPALEVMAAKYGIIEMNTAVKPFYMEYLYRRNPNVEMVIYLDPDILVCDRLSPLKEQLERHHIVVTPHCCTFDDSPADIYYELLMLSGGIYNLGFIGTARSETTFAFLQWWQRRLKDYCYYDPGSGIFVDQLWVTLAPVFFPGVYVEKNPGYNMSYWNLFERRLTRRNGHYLVNNEHALLFYHFSSYKPENPDLVTKVRNGHIPAFSERPDLKAIYDEYHHRLLESGYTTVKSVPYSLYDRATRSQPALKKTLKRNIRAVLRALPRNIQRSLKRVARFTIYSYK